MERLLHMTMFRDKKIHLNVGTIGHFSHGKTTLTAAITAVLAGIGYTEPKKNDAIDSTSEEKARNMSIYVHHVEYETAARHYSHLDCPGHVDYINNLMTGVSQMDGAILVVSAVDGPMAQTKEHILLAKLLGISSILVFINKQDELDDQEVLPMLIQDMRQILIYYGFPGHTSPIICGSALLALEAMHENPNLNRGKNKWVDKVFSLIDHLDLYIPTPRRKLNKPFLMPIERVILVPSFGLIGTGTIERGHINIGESVEIVGLKDTKYSKVISLKMFNKSLEQGIAGDDIGISLEGTNKNNFKKGMVIAKPNTIQSWNHFEAQIYLLRREEGGRRSPFFQGYCPQFYFRTIQITGRMESFEYEMGGKTWMVMPGEKIKAIIQLIFPIALKKKMRFVIREGGFTIGVGIILELIR
jgi:elongation factor Tu